MGLISTIYKPRITPMREIGKRSKRPVSIGNPVPKQAGESASAAERLFVRRAKARGWQVLRNGWPDYLLVKRNAQGGLEFRAVEVKCDHENDCLRDTQELMLASLALQGLDCYVWSAETSTLRKIERQDAQYTIDAYFTKRQADQVHEALRSIKMPY